MEGQYLKVAPPVLVALHVQQLVDVDFHLLVAHAVLDLVLKQNGALQEAC